MVAEVYLEQRTLFGGLREIRGEEKRAFKVLGGSAEIAELAQGKAQAEMGGRRAGVDGEGAAIALCGGFRSATQAMGVSQTEKCFLRRRRELGCRGEMGQCTLEVASLSVERTQQRMRAGVRRLSRQNAFANGTSRDMIPAFEQPARVFELCRRRSLALRRPPEAAFSQHLFEDRKQHRSRLAGARLQRAAIDAFRVSIDNVTSWF